MLYCFENNCHSVPLLHSLFGVTNGGRVNCSNYNRINLYNSYYDFCTEKYDATFSFNFFGVIIYAAGNVSESWHHTRLARVSGLHYPMLFDSMNPPQMDILRDSTFFSNVT